MARGVCVMADGATGCVSLRMTIEIARCSYIRTSYRIYAISVGRFDRRVNRPSKVIRQIRRKFEHAERS
jgi:hypothetical protein